MSEVKIHPNVTLGAEPKLGEFVVLGQPTRFRQEVQTRIGDQAEIRTHTVIYAGAQIGHRFFCGHHVTIRENCRIGNDVSVGTHCVIEHNVTIEDGVRLHSAAYIPEFSVLRAGCWIGPRVCLTNAKYPTSPGVTDNLAGPEVGQGAVIGANATLLPGVKIGAHAVVGAGAVVTKDVEPEAVVVGNPARQIKTVQELHY